jgi:hypothetical protein
MNSKLTEERDDNYYLKRKQRNRDLLSIATRVFCASNPTSSFTKECVDTFVESAFNIAEAILEESEKRKQQ